MINGDRVITWKLDVIVTPESKTEEMVCRGDRILSIISKMCSTDQEQEGHGGMPKGRQRSSTMGERDCCKSPRPIALSVKVWGSSRGPVGMMELPGMDGRSVG